MYSTCKHLQSHARPLPFSCPTFEIISGPLRKCRPLQLGITLATMSSHTRKLHANAYTRSRLLHNEQLHGKYGIFFIRKHQNDDCILKSTSIKARHKTQNFFYSAAKRNEIDQLLRMRTSFLPTRALGFVYTDGTQNHHTSSSPLQHAFQLTHDDTHRRLLLAAIVTVVRCRRGRPFCWAAELRRRRHLFHRMRAT